MNGNAQTSVYEALIKHINAFWPTNAKERFTWRLGPIKSVLPNFSVIRIAPKDPGDHWVYLTHGAWEVDLNRGYRLEFFMMCPFESVRHIETLAMLAHFHSNQMHHLDVGRSVKIGRGWLEGSNYDHLLVSLPYPYGRTLEVCKINKALMIRYLWLLPINAVEYDYLMEFGLEALEKKLDEAEINFLDPARRSVI